MRKLKPHKLNDLSRSLTALDVHHTLIAVIEMSLSSWVVAGIVPGVERQPLKKLDTDENALLKLLDRWRKEAEGAGHKIRRIAVAFEAGRDGFWLARWLRAHGIEVHVIHASSVAVSREHRRAPCEPSIRDDSANLTQPLQIPGTSHVDRILKGSLSGELPIEVASHHELAVNLLTARHLSVTVPPELLAQAGLTIQ